MILVVQFVNFTLALLMWMILGRAALGVLTRGRDGVLQRVFDRITSPVLALTRSALPDLNAKWAPLAALFALGALRLGLVLLTHPASGR